MKQEVKNRKRVTDLQDVQDLSRSQISSMSQYGQMPRPRSETGINQYPDNTSMALPINSSRPPIINSLNMSGDMTQQQQHYGSYPTQQTQFFYSQQNVPQVPRPMVYQEFPQSQQQQQQQLRQYEKVSPSQLQYDPQQYDSQHQHYYQQQQNLPQHHSSPISDLAPQNGSYPNSFNQPSQSRLSSESSKVSDDIQQFQRMNSQPKEGQRSIDNRSIPSDYQQIDDPESPKSKLKNSNRGNYVCRKCGEPKKGHVCAYQTRSIPKNDGSRPQTAEIGIQVEFDEEMTVRKLKLEIQGLPESYYEVEQTKNPNSNNFHQRVEDLANEPGVQTKLSRQIQRPIHSNNENRDDEEDDDEEEDDEEDEDDDDDEQNQVNNLNINKKYNFF